MTTTARRLHFISGLPRSGSTLLSAILKQNPRFHAGMSGPLGGLLETVLTDLSDRNQFAMFITDDQRRRVLKGLFDHYYGPELSAQVVFDTNRIWCGKMPLLGQLFPEARVIACVRQVPWIIDSFERLVRNNALRPSGMFHYEASGTVYSRAEILAQSQGMVGSAYNALKEAFYGENCARLLVLQYETLTTRPAAAMRAVYAFLGEPVYGHDFDNLRFEASEFDQRLGVPGLHEVSGSVKCHKRRTVLPPDVFSRYEKDAFWLDPDANPRGVTVL